MSTTHDGHHDACVACQQAGSLGFEFTMAFQPIVDIRERTVFAYEALVRGTDGAGAGSILARVNEDNRYRFDQACRTKAVELAARLGIGCYVSINFLPNAVYNPAACIRTTLKAAERYDFPTDRLLFEVTENERVVDRDHLKGILQDYQQRGFKTAIDDFGAGYSGLGLLADFQPDFIKIDMALVRDIESHPVRQAIVTGILSVCAGLDIAVIAEGVETMAEYTWLKDRGVRYIQGFLLAEPGFETLPPVQWPA